MNTNTREQTAYSLVAPKAAAVAIASKAPSHGDPFADTYSVLDQLAVEREAWQDGVYRESNEQLYKLLARCYAFYVEKLCADSALGKTSRAALEDYFNMKGLRFTKNTHTLTKIVKCVFGVDRRRASVYSIVLREAHMQNVAVADIPSFIAQRGGVEEIRLSRSSTAKTPKQKASIARQFLADAELAIASGPRLSEVLDAGNADKDLVAIVTAQANGTLIVRALVYGDGALNAALAGYHSSNKADLGAASAKKQAANDEQRRDQLIDEAA